MVIDMRLGERGYDIVVERGCIKNAGALLGLDSGKTLVVTDSGVPPKYPDAVLSQCARGSLHVIGQGEQNKSLAVFEEIMKRMLELEFSRADHVVAVGGGIVGDMAGFAAACYMRGVSFCNIPTTLLSQIDSSIGGKTAVNLCGVKNVVGAFYQPKKVLIDPETLATLPERQLANGLAEAVKMALTFDAPLFGLFEKGEIKALLDEIIVRSLNIKKNVVERDERESGLRKALNFGHTLGHGVESAAAASGLYHGECVAVGMVPMCAGDVRRRLVAVLEKCGLPTRCDCDIAAVMEAVRHDKKRDGERITAVCVEEVGSFRFCEMELAQLERLAREAWGV